MSPIQVAFDVTDQQLLNKFYTDILPSAVDSVDPKMKPAWGEMSPQHMIEHLLFAFQISTGKLKVECHTPEHKREKLRTFLERNIPMPKGFTNPVTGDSLPALQFENLAQSQELLHSEIEHFLQFYENHPNAVHTNPMFGELGSDLWKKFHFKHCFHHLEQFKVIQEAK